MSALRFIAILMLTSLANGQAASNPKIGQSNTPKPKLPVVDEYACPGKGNSVPNVKISQDDRIYRSWQGNDKSIGTLKAGEEVTVLTGVNLVREPDRAVIRYVSPDASPSLKVGDVALGYGLDADENIVFWSNGVWFGEWIEAVGKMGGCGFRGGFAPDGCHIDIIEDGVMEWWVRVKTSKGLTGWVLAHKWTRGKNWWGNFVDLCHYGED